ncbi:hypothetical protein LUZ63_013479 [Rhynchospora breviuscula]|uniref:Uncharacterized protein n=1 Tax=Rhynchospora breviuscula TaxID=2022672 RepID=A0A9Q0HKM1_9POAL|nr:hypothetical protein LUZ63_013479 [Rhynchospora breviuscula]
MASWVSSAASFIVECAASVVVEKIVETGLSYLGKRMLPDNTEEALRRVKRALPQIRAVMGVAEALKLKEPSSSEWVQQFRDAVDAAEDVLDELEYKKLEDTVKNRDEAGGSTSSSKKRKTGAISSNISERLREVVTMLDEAVAGVERLLQHADKLGIRYLSESQLDVRTDLSRETTSFLTEREVIGRDVEKDKIIGWLKRPIDAQLSCFGIVGVGGLGKTTLAQFAYQQMHGSDYFEKTIWVCVSTNFSVKGITAKILAELGENIYIDNPLNVLQKSLKEKIHTKKIFLILDDVWQDEKLRDWEQLIAPLRFTQQGSKILFTTRLKSVVDLLGCIINIEHQYLALADLGQQELQLLFNSYAFQGFNPDDYGDLQAIGAHIVKMLRGNPLAAKVIGSLLNSCMDQLYWRRILNHNSLINLEQAKDVMEVLKLSYYNLPADLQVCFRFCSIFPQDFEFDKRELIEMWMASGFIRQQSCQEKRPEDIGEDYFNHLLRKSFFECSQAITRIGPEKRYGEYVMHDLMHALAENVSNGECLRVAPDDHSITIPSTVRHISIEISEIQKASHLGNIRSLVITPCSGTNPNLFVLPNNLFKKSLRLLKIYGHVRCRLPVEISCLLHLRYVSIEVLPVKFLSSIYTLYHLQVLEFLVAIDESFNSGVKKHEMAYLVSLRYMRLPHEILQTICGVHRLTSLQELTFFVGQESGHQINELGTLNNLRRLDIYNIENIRNPSEAASANLLGKKSLQSLSLNYKSDPDNPEQIIDNLKPQPNLMTLKIENYNGQQSPIWLKDMPYLKILYIYNSPKLDKLPDMPLSLTEFRVWYAGLTSLPDLYQTFVINTLAPLSLKSSLRSVQIKQCPNLISLNGFLQQSNLDLGGLKELRIETCENLTLLPTHVFKTFVSLNHLCIGECPNLTRLPHLPLSLISFHIYEMAVSALPEHFNSPRLNDSPSTSSLNSSLKEVHITMCPNLTALNGFLQQDNIDFQAINKIVIWQCENLVHISRGAFGKFVSLTDLTISSCPKLVAVENQNNLLPSNLKHLYISNCGELDMPLLESSSGLTNLTELEILNCANITHIPSSEHVFGSLSRLDIRRCGKLIELSLMQQQQHNVDQRSNLASLKINDLSIDQLSLLLIEPLRSLRSVSDLCVHDCSRLETLPEQWLLQNSSALRKLTIWNASSVQSLPTSMVRLTALEELSIRNADLLVELPELPVSLKFWTICSSDGINKFK